MRFKRSIDLLDWIHIGGATLIYIAGVYTRNHPFFSLIIALGGTLLVMVREEMGRG